MKPRSIAIIALLAVFLALGLLLLLSSPSHPSASSPPSPLQVGEISRAGDALYATVSTNGSTQVSLLAFSRAPQRRVFVLEDPNAIGTKNFDHFLDSLSPLVSYGYQVDSGPGLRDVPNGIYIVPTGAMPDYVLDQLGLHPNRTVVYLGRKDLIIQNGIKSSDWYSELDEPLRERLVVYNTTLDDLYSVNRTFLLDELLSQPWALSAREDFNLSRPANRTLQIVAPGASHLRLLWSEGNHTRLLDSQELPAYPSINVSPSSFFPWETPTVTLALNRTRGVASFLIYRQGRLISNDSIGRVSEDNLFFFQPSLAQPGDYVLRVMDDGGVRAQGLLHVQELSVRPLRVVGTQYVFAIQLDGEPLPEGEALVRLNYSAHEEKFFFRDGELTIPAQVRKGAAAFRIRLLGHEFFVPVESRPEGLLDLYLRYGLPGVLVILVVFVAARMARHPSYKLRFGDPAGMARRDVPLSRSRALEVFSGISRELGVDGPITAHEFAIGLKRHVSEGAEVADGNVEAILKELIQAGLLQTHLGFYQPKGSGNLRRRVLERLVRETLIEEGVPFQYREGRFILRDLDIGFFGDRFERRSLVVIGNMGEKERLCQKLKPSGRSLIRLQELNGRLRFVTPAMLKEIL